MNIHSVMATPALARRGRNDLIPGAKKDAILRAATDVFAERGFFNAQVADVAHAAGVAAGTVYLYFRSKDDLLAAAIEEAFSDFGEKVSAALQDVPAAERWKEIVRWYLSPEHCEHADTGCPIAALAPEIARAAPAVRKRIAGTLKAWRKRMLEFMPGGTAAERERNFTIIFTAMAGAVSIARILPDPVEKQNILSSVREHLLQSF